MITRKRGGLIMFFRKTQDKQRNYAERVLRDFCILARENNNLSIDEQIERVDTTLGSLQAMLNFKKEEEDLRQAQQELQESSEKKEKDPLTRKQLSKLAIAMNTLIFYFNKEENDEQRKIFTTVVQTAIENFKIRKVYLEEIKLAEQKKLALALAKPSPMH